jgi:hypothetical protein
MYLLVTVLQQAGKNRGHLNSGVLGFTVMYAATKFFFFYFFTFPKPLVEEGKRRTR